MINQGEALIKIASTYPTIMEVVLEEIQNALDVNAKKIWVMIDMQKRKIICQDNGEGVNQEGFEEALASVGKSIKGKGKLGRYGIGLIAALGKCTYFTFTSSQNKKKFLEWVFKTNAIAKQADNINIPVKDKVDLPGKSQEWSTQVAVFNFTKDRIISRINMESLKTSILDRYGAVMRKQKTSISITLVKEDGIVEEVKHLRAKKFAGKQLPEVIIENKDGGKVTFKLFIAKGKKGGRVLVGETNDEYRFSWPEFLRSLSNASFLPENTAKALGSGVFEGEITGEKIELNPSRKSFKRNDALAGFCETIWEWFEEYGKNHLEEAREALEEQRFQKLGLESIKNLEHLFRNPELSEILKVILRFKLGTQGRGHVPNEAKGKGAQDETSLSPRGGGGESRSSASYDGLKKPPKTGKPKERPGHIPGSVIGPSGRRRNVVSRDSLGLQIAYDEMAEDNNLWKLDTEKGILFINRRHPIWANCDDEGTDKTIMQLQEMISITALLLESMPEDWRPHQEELAKDLVKYFGYLIVGSGAFRNRIKKRK